MRALLPFILFTACSAAPINPAATSGAPATSDALATSVAARTSSASVAPPVAMPAPLATATVPSCEAFDWSARRLGPLLRPGKSAPGAPPKYADRPAAEQGAFDSECEDAPDGPSERSPTRVTIDGVTLSLASVTPAGKSGRGWAGNQCTFSVRLADGSGREVRLDEREIPPFNRIAALARAGSAVFLSVAFNGYTKEFPQGGNRVVALDLCAGRVVWKSPDSTSNGGLLLLGDYLIAPYGFTSEPRSLFVLDARSGSIVQRLPVIENVCPNERWAPNWHRGERCDAPGQKVGAATNPHIAGGLLLVDTNTGSAAFQFE